MLWYFFTFSIYQHYSENPNCYKFNIYLAVVLVAVDKLHKQNLIIDCYKQNCHAKFNVIEWSHLILYTAQRSFTLENIRVKNVCSIISIAKNLIQYTVSGNFWDHPGTRSYYTELQ